MSNDSDAGPVKAGGGRRKAGAIGLVAAGVVTGGVLAGTLTAGAAGSNNSTSGTPAAGSTAPPAHSKSSTPVRSDEKATSTDVAATIKAKALKAVPGGTVYRIETDAGDGAYEAHMTKADGTPVTVKFDKDLTVTKVEAGMGLGDPRPAGGGPHGAPGSYGGAPAGAAPGAPVSSA
jgi:hypothetical protein